MSENASRFDYIKWVRAKRSPSLAKRISLPTSVGNIAAPSGAILLSRQCLDNFGFIDVFREAGRQGRPIMGTVIPIDPGQSGNRHPDLTARPVRVNPLFHNELLFVGRTERFASLKAGFRLFSVGHGGDAMPYGRQAASDARRKRLLLPDRSGFEEMFRGEQHSPVLCRGRHL